LCTNGRQPLRDNHRREVKTKNRTQRKPEYYHQKIIGRGRWQGEQPRCRIEQGRTFEQETNHRGTRANPSGKETRGHSLRLEDTARHWDKDFQAVVPVRRPASEKRKGGGGGLRRSLTCGSPEKNESFLVEARLGMAMKVWCKK